MISFDNIMSLVVSVINWILKRREDRIEVILQRVPKSVKPIHKPVECDWSIRIQCVSKPIERCKIIYNGNPLPWWDSDEPYYERVILLCGGGIVGVPKDIEKEDAEVIVKNGDKTLRKVRYKDLPEAHN